MIEQQPRDKPATPDYSRENVIWARMILLSGLLILGFLLFALALPSIRERFF